MTLARTELERQIGKEPEEDRKRDRETESFKEGDREMRCKEGKS